MSATHTFMVAFINGFLALVFFFLFDTLREMMESPYERPPLVEIAIIVAFGIALVLLAISATVALSAAWKLAWLL